MHDYMFSMYFFMPDMMVVVILKRKLKIRSISPIDGRRIFGSINNQSRGVVVAKFYCICRCVNYTHIHPQSISLIELIPTMMTVVHVKRVDLKHVRSGV